MNLEFNQGFDFYHLGWIQPEDRFSSLDSLTYSSIIPVGLALQGPMHGMALVLIDRHSSLLDDASMASELANVLGSKVCNQLQASTKIPTTLTPPEVLTLDEVETVAEKFNQIYRKDFVWKHSDDSLTRVRLMVFGQELNHAEASHVRLPEESL